MLFYHLTDPECGFVMFGQALVDVFRMKAHVSRASVSQSVGLLVDLVDQG